MNPLQSLILFLLLPALTTSAQTTAPILRLNTEMHTALVRGINTDPAGKYLLTVSNDKTAKLWDTSSGELLQTFRVPIGEGNEGRLDAGAIHPDGGQVAVSGWTSKDGLSNSIYIFDTRSAAIVNRISGLPNVIQDLEYAPSGNYLAVTLGSSNGIRIYHTNTYDLYKSDSRYKGSSVSAAFDATGRLATICDDGFVRLYDAEFKMLKKTKPLSEKHPLSLAFSPDGRALAVCFSGSPIAKMLDSRTLDELFEIDDAGYGNHGISFSRDGSHLIAGGFAGEWKSGKRWTRLRVWTQAGKGSYVDYNVCNRGGVIMDIKPLPDGNIAFCSTAAEWGIIHSETGNRRVFKPSELNIYGGLDFSHFMISNNGYTVGITPFGEKALTFNLNNRGIVEKAAELPTYTDVQGSLKISDWCCNGLTPKINSNSLTFLRKGELSTTSVDISSDASKVILGTEWNLYCLNAQGMQLWKVPVQTGARCVNISGDDRVVAASYGDGTVRWHRLSDGMQLLTLFMHPDNQRWVIWTPSGYYDAAPGAEELIGWHVNRSEDEAALFYPISKFRSQYYRPDVIDRMLETLDEAEALRQANEMAERFTNTVSRTRNIADELPPTIKILNPAPGAAVSTSEVTIEYSIQSPNDEAVTGIKAFINGRPVSGSRGLKPTGLRSTLSVTIPAEDCRVSVIAENRYGASEQASVQLKWAGSGTSSAVSQYKPTLYVLAIGVSDYNDAELKLDFAAKDARDFKQAISNQHGLLYQSVQCKILTDAEATRPNILDGLEWIVKQTTQHDVAMIFFAGHGRETSRGTFYYVPVEADLSDASLRRNGIMREDIKETVATVVGKVIVFMDACHSGSLMETSRRRGTTDMTRIINELADAENGAITFSSSSGRQFSMENASWGNGAFTKALVEGLNGKAANGDGSITWKSLDNYITRRVKELTNGEQSAVTTVPPDTEDYPIGVRRE